MIQANEVTAANVEQYNTQLTQPLPVKKDGKIKASQRWVSIAVTLLISGHCRPCVTSGGSWTHSSMYDETFAIMQWLDKNGLKYEKGNDAPRGGKTGAFIKLIR